MKKLSNGCGTVYRMVEETGTITECDVIARCYELIIYYNLYTLVAT